MKGYRSAATLIIVAFHHILRTNEFMDIRGPDIAMDGKSMLVVLRDTKIGQRLGINQEIVVTSGWLVTR